MSTVSIIMPVYNAALWLEDCLLSIVSQTYKDWQLIAVDDFSTDASVIILQSFAQQDQRIKIYKNTKKGITPALKLGYSKSSGKYITRMDADDVMPSTKLNSMLGGLKETAQVVTGKVKYIASGKELMDGYIRYADWLNVLVTTNTHYDHVYRECVVPSCCWMMERSIFDSIGGFEASTYPEDYDFVFRMYKYQLKIKCLDKILHIWRDHENRASRTDPNYVDQSFVEMKVKYFLALDRDEKLSFYLWGAGRSGKAIARQFIDLGISFSWVTDNTNKVGHNIYDIILQEANSMEGLEHAQIITAVKTPDFKESNAHTFTELKGRGVQVFHFH